MSNSSNWLTDQVPNQVLTLQGTMAMKRVHRIPQRSIITGTLPSDCLMSYPGHLLMKGSYPFAEMQSVYSTGPADWAYVFSCVC